MTYEQLQDTLFRWFQGAAGTAVIWEHGNAPRPAKEYLSLFGPRLVRESEPVTWQGAELNNGRDVEVTTSISYSVYVTCTFHRCDAMSRAWTMQQRLYSDSPDPVIDPLSFIESEEITQVPQLLESEYEPRAQFVIRFRLATSTTIAVPVILEASVTACDDIGEHHG